ncbi:MAG: hypothetical protein KGS44_16400 [Alphaproteobacteria bacterium]|nr:hypothetical protein [Alphaproteobacteria bacterium]
MKLKAPKWMLLVGAAVLLIISGYFVFDFLVVDDCLDAGGRWLSDEMRCEGARAGV